VSAQYLSFVFAYAVLLMVASLVVFADGGRAFILRFMERIGGRTGVGPWGFLHTFGYDAPMENVPLHRRAELAEAYIVSAQAQTLSGARVVLWVLISGFLACAAAAILIVGILPLYFVAGTLSYEAYRRASVVVVNGTAAGGLAMGACLVAWLWRSAAVINRTEGCAAARSLVTVAQRAGVPPELQRELASGKHPRLGRLLREVGR